MEDKRSVPKLESISKYQPWMRQFRAFLASMDLASVLLPNFQCPTTAHPSLEARIATEPALIPVGQAAVPMVAARENAAAVPAQAAGMTQENFDILRARYFTYESKVYGFLISAIEQFITLYDYIMKLDEVVQMQISRLLGSRISYLVTQYCTNNDSDNLSSLTITRIVKLRLDQFNSCADLIREFDQLYHVLPVRMAYSDASKKLQLQVACGDLYKFFFMAAGDDKTYVQLCASLEKMEVTAAVAAALDDTKSERGVLKQKATDESKAETAMASVEENTERNRSSLSVRFNPRGHNQKYNSRSRSRSHSSDRGKHGYYPKQRQRESSRSPSRSPGRHGHVIRYSEANQQWRTGGSAYKDQNHSRPNTSRDPSSSKCFTCGGSGHKSNVCPNNAAPSTHYGPSRVTCFSCGKPGHKANECRNRSSR